MSLLILITQDLIDIAGEYYIVLLEMTPPLADLPTGPQPVAALCQNNAESICI